jgi:hypothetical protein
VNHGGFWWYRDGWIEAHCFYFFGAIGEEFADGEFDDAIVNPVNAGCFGIKEYKGAMEG